MSDDCGDDGDATLARPGTGYCAYLRCIIIERSKMATPSSICLHILGGFTDFSTIRYLSTSISGDIPSNPHSSPYIRGHINFSW